MRILLLLLLSAHCLAQQGFNISTDLDYLDAEFQYLHSTDSGYFVLGVVNDTVPPHRQGALVSFWDLSGQLQWHKALKDTVNGYFMEKWDVQDSFFIGTGGSIGKAIVLKFNPDGDTIWSTSFPDTTTINPNVRQLAFSVVADKIAVYLCLWRLNITNGDSYGNHLIKLDANGSVVWDTILHDTNREEYQPMLGLVSNELVLFTDYWDNLISGKNNLLYRSFDTSGTLNFENILIPPIGSQTYGAMNALVNTYDSGWLAVSGHGILTSLYIHGPILHKLDGSQQWQRTHLCCSFGTGNLSKYISTALQHPDSSYSLIGTFPFKDSSITSVGAEIIKLSASGDSLWVRNYFKIRQGSANQVTHAQLTSDGGYIICGHTDDGNKQEGWLLKLDSMGCLVPGCHLISTTRLPDNEQIDLKIYPNPATDYINLYLPRIEGIQNLHLHLYNLQGQLLQNHPLPQSDMTYMLSTEGLSSGVYVVQVLDEEGKMLGSEKVIIQ